MIKKFIPQKSGNSVIINKQTYPIFPFPHDILNTSFRKHGKPVAKPLNYIGLCKLTTIKPHPTTSEQFTQISNDIIYFVDESGKLYMVGFNIDGEDPKLSGNIRGEFLGFQDIDLIKPKKDYTKV